jgi:hypothetical protein
MRKLSNVDAYTMEQVRRADYATNCGLGFAGLQSSPTAQVGALDTVHVQLQAAVCAMPDSLA